MGLLHRCWQRLRTRRQVILSLTILPLDRGSPALMGGALLLTLAGKGQFHSFSRRNHHRDQRRGPRQHRRSASLRTAPNLAFHVLWPRLLGPHRHPIAGPQRVRHPSRMVVALCRRFRIPGNPTFRSSLDLSNHFG